MGKWGDILLLLVSAKGSKFMVIMVFSLFLYYYGGWRSLSSALYIPSTVLEDYTIHNLAYHYLLTIYTDIFHITGIKYMPSSWLPSYYLVTIEPLISDHRQKLERLKP